MFISLEGIEGSGKSTQVRNLGAWLETRGRQVKLTREPGSTALGQKLRALLLDSRQSPIGATAELFLFLADRAQHVQEVIRPALDAGQIVICDRYADSTIAYQGYGRGMDLAQIKGLCHQAAAGLEPDLTLILDISPDSGLARAAQRNYREGTAESEGRFEAESLAFHGRIRDGYLALARECPARFEVIDAGMSEDKVFEQCLNAVVKRMGYV